MSYDLFTTRHACGTTAFGVLGKLSSDMFSLHPWRLDGTPMELLHVKYVRAKDVRTVFLFVGPLMFVFYWTKTNLSGGTHE